MFFVFPLQVNGIVRKLQEELQELRGKNKMKNGVIVSQEKVLQETTVELQRVQKDCRSTQETLASKEGQVGLRVLTNIAQQDILNIARIH